MYDTTALIVKYGISYNYTIYSFLSFQFCIVNFFDLLTMLQ